MSDRLIFVSYSHKDNDQDHLVLRVLTHLRSLRSAVPGLDIWVDAKNIRAGDAWAAEIDGALTTASLAVMLVSPDFLDSAFIRDHELPRLWQRHETGLRLIPIRLRPCTEPDQIRSLEMRPRGDSALALSVIGDQGPATLDRALQAITEEIKTLLGPAGEVTPEHAGVGPASSGDVEEARCIALLTKTLFGNGSSEFYTALAAKLVREIQRCANVSGDALFDAVRFFIEFQLLTSDDATSPAALEASLGLGGARADETPLVAQLRQMGRTAQFSTASREVASRFFGLTNSHAELWKTYFDAVVAAGASTQGRVGSLVSVKSTVGYLAPQFLVAGLLARFDDDWRPVLNVYSRSTPNPRHKEGAFESLQASQWNCWLMWGPSIPVCQCPQWSGLCALQYGYGDENNSLPVIDPAAGDGIGEVLGPVVSSLRGERRGAKFGALTGRLRWGPYFLRSQDGPEAPGADAEPEIVDRDAEIVDADAVAPSGKHGAAPAQASLYAEHGPAHRQTAGGLVLELERLDRASPQSRVYFSAYLWVMFLVATGPGTGTGPHLLSGKPCPGWSDDEEVRRKHAVDGRFWQDLLPIFVHANIGDPHALAFQKQVLVENAVQLLRGVWSRRVELFHPESVEAGLRFYLVCASDHSGCGHEPRFPSDDSLVTRLRARLADEPDRELAEHVLVPAVPGGHGLDGIESYFSACHLPDLIGWYYDYVFELNRARPRAT